VTKSSLLLYMNMKVSNDVVMIGKMEFIAWLQVLLMMLLLIAIHEGKWGWLNNIRLIKDAWELLLISANQVASTN
jgi:hypothetical protein